ncbi:MAG: glycoside hydrolase family 3 protein, partial [Bacteroidales bacterium]|nr:glycoside hydrolase family 3 protein [Bacteroidales bacterium]
MERFITSGFACSNIIICARNNKDFEHLGKNLHFAVNNQETNRGSVDAQLDERTLREIYLKPFVRAIIEGGAMSVMPAYNKVNGDYCSENEHLLNEILRGEWGFKGYTVSDWGGTHSTM